MVPSSRARVQSFQDLLWDMLVGDRADEDVVAKTVSIAWAMWHNRNEIRNGGKRRNGKELVSWASQYMEEYEEASESIVSKASLVEGRNT